MTSPPGNPPILVETAPQLDRALQAITRQVRFGLDTESNSLYAYQERVCLIQVSIPGTDYLIDPLALPDLAPLGELLADPSIEKVLHGAEYDVLCLQRDFRFRLRNLFDTRMASRSLGWPRSGLGDLLVRVLGVTISKRFQRANWGRRPLPQEMLSYARLDTHYLLPLRDHLARELETAGQWAAFKELCAHLAELEAKENGFDPQGFWQIRGARHLSARGQALLQELYLLRDQLARELDQPPFKVLSDPGLIALAKSPPRRQSELTRTPGISERTARKFGAQMMDAIRRASNGAPPKRPRQRGMDDLAHARFEALRQWRKQIAQRLKVESDIILPRDLMLSLATHPPRTLQELEARMGPLQLRFRLYGEAIFQTLTQNRKRPS